MIISNCLPGFFAVAFGTQENYNRICPLKMLVRHLLRTALFSPPIIIVPKQSVVQVTMLTAFRARNYAAAPPLVICHSGNAHSPTMICVPASDNIQGRPSSLIDDSHHITPHPPQRDAVFATPGYIRKAILTANHFLPRPLSMVQSVALRTFASAASQRKKTKSLKMVFLFFKLFCFMVMVCNVRHQYTSSLHSLVLSNCRLAPPCICLINT